MVEKLFEIIDKNCSNIDKNLIQKAYDLAFEAHETQKRESGEPYIIHPIEVACILAEIGMDTSTICAGILHDVVEDTDYTYDDILNIFGKEVADLVQGVTKLGKIKYKSKEEQQADNVRKMLLAMAKDIRVILIKLADRLHNLRTLKYMPEHKQKQKAKETLDIYAPLAHRLGISKIKWELEDLSLRYLKPDEYYDLVEQICAKRVEREAYISEIVDDLSKNISKSGIKADIQGRPKHFYSIYNKMQKKNKSLDQIFDLTAIRILVETVVDCYATLGIVHTMYKPMPGRFKDYIAMPKPNMYQSLHTTVMGPKGKPFEIQIRTYEMHNTAEYGIAAHWKYKEGANGENNNLENKLTWLSDILEWQGETSDAEEFMEAFKIDLFSDEIFVFTPKGRVISLPNESTPIDFAYRIHTDVGHRCIGAKVNGKIVPLDFKLKTGEIVEVITSPMDKAPSIDWLSVVKSNHAKSKIKAWYNKARRDEHVSKGKELLEKEAKKQGYHLGDIIDEEEIKKLYKKYSIRVIDDLFAIVGTGSLIPSTIILKLKEAYLAKNKKETITLEQVQEDIKQNNNRKNKENSHKKSKSPEVVIKGIDNVMIRFARCCNPVPGDEIIGYITKGRGVSVHRKDCKNVQCLIKSEQDKILEVSWGNINGGEFTTEIQVKGEDRLGLLAEVMEILSAQKIHLRSISANSGKDGYALINIKITVSSVQELVDLKKFIRKVKGVRDVYRLI